MKLSDSNINYILSKYDLGFVKNKRIVYDKWNTSFFVKSDKGKFLVKVLHFQDKDDLKKGILIVRNLRDKIPVVIPILTVEGKDYIKYRGKIIIVYPFIKGKPWLRGETLSRKNLFLLGKYLGIIHKTRKNFKIKKKDLLLYMRKLFEGINKRTEEYRIFNEVNRILRENNFKPESYPKGLIHGDLHTENLLIEKGKIALVLDFEEAHIGSFIYDLGLCIFDTCYKNGRILDERMKILINGYENIRKLTNIEKKNLINSTLLMGLYTLYFLVRKNGANNKKNVDYYLTKRLVKMIEKYGVKK